MRSLLLLLALATACSATDASTAWAVGAKVAAAHNRVAAGPTVALPESRADLKRVPARLDAAPEAPPVDPEPVPAAPLEPFAMSLYQEGDWVQQYTFEWCVAASVQMAWNMVHPEVRTARDDQEALWNKARDHSNNPYRGADPGGWTDLLNELGLGPYELVSIPEYDQALRVAVAAMSETQRPVGLVMWRGRHAWVMSGFETLGDPSQRSDFEITGINVVDPLYPYGSGIWGPSPEPNARLSPDELAKQFVFREQRRWSSHVPAGFLLVLPVSPEPEPVHRPRGFVIGPGAIRRFVPLEAL